MTTTTYRPAKPASDKQRNAIDRMRAHTQLHRDLRRLYDLFPTIYHLVINEQPYDAEMDEAADCALRLAENWRRWKAGRPA